MRLFSLALSIGLIAGIALGAEAATKAAKTDSGAPPAGPSSGHIEVTADQTLEWYQDQRIYVARGNAKAVRGDMTVTADVLTAHERDQPAKPGSAKAKAAAATTSGTTTTPAPEQAAATSQQTSPTTTAATGATPPATDNGTGDIDKMTAEGNVRVVTSKSTITGDHGVYDLVQHVAYVTGNNLKYQTAEEVVTSKDSLEYWEDKKIAVARGNAVGIRGDRHVEGDVLTAQFRDMPNGKSQLQTMTSEGHVVVITTNDVSRADRAVYDINRNIAVLTGNVRITRADGTQLTGDVGEVDFAANQSRLMNEGTGRVRALLTSKTSPKTGTNKATATPVSATTSATTSTTAAAR